MAGPRTPPRNRGKRACAPVGVSDPATGGPGAGSGESPLPALAGAVPVESDPSDPCHRCPLVRSSAQYVVGVGGGDARFAFRARQPKSADSAIALHSVSSFTPAP